MEIESVIKWAAEHESIFFQVEVDPEGVKVIHVDGYFYTADEPGYEAGVCCPEKTWRHVSYGFYIESLKAVLEEGLTEWYTRTESKQNQHIGDCTLDKVHEDALRYFGEEPPTPICEQDLSVNTPCGCYVLSVPTDGPFFSATSEGEVTRIKANPILIDNGETEFCVMRDSVAEAIASIPANWCCTVLDATTGQELASTFGNFLNRADPAFRNEIIDQLIWCQQNPDEVGLIPAIEAE